MNSDRYITIYDYKIYQNIIDIIVIIVLLLLIYLFRKKYNTNNCLNLKKITKHESVIRLLLKTDNDKTAFYTKKSNKWIGMKYSEYKTNTLLFSKKLISIFGTTKPINVAIYGFNSPGWMISHMGTIMAGGISVGIYPTMSTDNFNYILKDAKINVLVVSNNDQLSKINISNDNANMFNGVDLIISYDEKLNDNYIKFFNDSKINYYHWNDFMTYDNRINDIQILEPNMSSVATVIYTSGTLGNVKGVMITHSNIIHMLNNIYQKHKEYINKTGECILSNDNRIISYLPLNHIAGQMFDIYLPIYTSCSVYFPPSDIHKSMNLLKVLREVKPTIFVGVPRVWEKIKDGISNKLNNYKIISYFPFVHKYIIDKIGLGECLFFVSTAAPLSTSVKNYFKNMGIFISNVYGLSETTGIVSFNMPYDNCDGCVGKPLPNVRVKIHKKTNEILVKGNTIALGYVGHNVDSFTNDRLWYKTGDMGYTKNGYLFITGRLKELIITSGGENVSPLNIEEKLRSKLPFFSYILVIGNERKFLSVLFTLKTKYSSGDSKDSNILLSDDVVKLLNELGSKSKTTIEIVDDKLFKKYIDGVIKEVNKTAESNVHTIKKWIILPDEFTIDGGELTPTLKVKRQFIENKYKNDIDKLYM